jgi:hypothetical protein
MLLISSFRHMKQANVVGAEESRSAIEYLASNRDFAQVRV